MEFERTSRRPLNLQLTPLIDVMFILIIFFMLTTSFMRIESLELGLPSAGAVTDNRQDVTRLFIAENGEMMLGQQKLVQGELGAAVEQLLKRDPSARILLLTADGVTMQQLVDVMDKVYMSGGKSLLVRKWEKSMKAGGR